MAKRFRDDTLDSDSTDEYYFESDKTEDDGVASSSGSEICTIRNPLRHFNISSDSSSDREVNIQESNNSRDNECRNVTNEDVIPKKIPFRSESRNPGSQLNPNYTEPLEYFNSFFTNELIKTIVAETNRYANNKIRGKRLAKRSTWHLWTDITTKELRAFLGIILLMGTIPLPNLKEYWSTDNKCRIKKLGKVWKLAGWVPHELNDNNKAERVRIFTDLLQRNERDPFLKDLVTGDESWLLFKNLKRKKVCVLPGVSPKEITKVVHCKKAMWCVWWDRSGIIHWEIILNGICYWWNGDDERQQWRIP
ncbi:Mariner Mos1 transposase [Anthophora quadrimaculata]